MSERRIAFASRTAGRATPLLFAAFTGFAATSAATAQAAASSSIPTPASVIGFEPGADRKLPTWKQVTDYFTALDKASPRVIGAHARQDDVRPAVHRRVHLRSGDAREPSRATGRSSAS